MNVEQRLLRAFEQVDHVEPSSDLWSRVVHSIDEDRAHRRRVAGSVLGIAAAVCALVVVGAASLRDGPDGRYVARPVMEALELVGLVVVVVTLGPAVRRFGRHYAHDLFPAAHRLATTLLRLIDVAYYLVFAGYILTTTQFEFELGVPGLPAGHDLPQQLSEAATRLGGLLFLMGVLHAAALVVLPVIALVQNSTQHGRALPRWMRNAGIVLVALAVCQLLGVAMVLFALGAG